MPTATYSPRFRLFPDERQREQLAWTIDTVRQVYNDALRRFKQLPTEAGTLGQRVRQVRDRLPALKERFPEWRQVYSTVLQQAVEQIEQNMRSLWELRDQGYDVGELRWKAPREYTSSTYRQRGFELDKKSGPDGRGMLVLKKVRGETIRVPIRLHRDAPDMAAVSHVTIKQEPSGAWYASFTVEREVPALPVAEDVTAEDVVGIDLGITHFVVDSDGRAIDRIDFTAERRRLKRAQRRLSRKVQGSANWERQRQRVAERHAEIKRKRRDFLHKLAAFYTSEYDAVIVEDLDVRPLLESDRGARSRLIAAVSWRSFIEMLEHHGAKRGCRVIQVEPAGTSKECAECGCTTAKPLWVREHSCPACGFEGDRDYNAALNVQERGLARLGGEHSEVTPVETAPAMDAEGDRSLDEVSVRRVIEAGTSLGNYDAPPSTK